MKKFVALFITSALAFSFIGCEKAVNSSANIVQEEKTELTLIKRAITEVDYSHYFDGIDGCAVFYDYKNNSLKLFNSISCEKRYSPNSIFKIISTIEGLESGSVISVNSKMQYNGESYPFESWNKNLTLDEAYKSSCVWYYRQLVNKIGKEKMQKALLALDYGNCDISHWNGEKENVQDDLNGFWLGSSLEISPLEAVKATAKIFEGESQYSKENIELLKGIMQSETEYIYGKTGTGKDNSAWYTGFFEKENKKIYFAIHINGNEAKSIAGADAKAITEKIIKMEELN